LPSVTPGCWEPGLLAVLELGHLLGDLFFGGVGIVVHSLGSVNDSLELSRRCNGLHRGRWLYQKPT
jgi:hypothetical protein